MGGAKYAINRGAMAMSKQSGPKGKKSAKNEGIPGPTEPIKLPEYIGKQVDFVCDEDRRYFEDHPKAKYYDRKAMPLELSPMEDGKNAMIRVFQIVPGARVRYPYPDLRDASVEIFGLPERVEDVFPKELIREMRKRAKVV
jgi:hypothetical protein